MNDDAHSELLDLIYETIVEPALWEKVLERIADSIGGSNGWLSQISMADGAGAGLIARIDPVMPGRYVDYYHRLNPFANKAQPSDYMSRWTPSVKLDTDIMAKDALRRTEFYNDFMRPQDVDGVLMIDVASRGLEISTLNIHHGTKRDFNADAIAFSRQLHPHLVRAYRLSGVFSDMRALSETGLALLDRSSHGLFVLDERGRIRHANAAGEAMIAARAGLDIMSGRLVALKADSRQRLEALIGAASSDDRAIRTGGSMAIRMPGHPALSVTVAPLGADRLAIMAGGPTVLVCATDLEASHAISERTLNQLFALTPAESRLIRHLMDGVSPAEAAALLGVSITTIRAHLKNIFEKTHTTGQADLSRLVMRVIGGALK